LTGSQAGYFSGGTRTIDWIQPGGTVAFVQVKVWKLATGVTYEVASQRTASVLMTIQTGGLNGAPPANLIGLQPFGFAVPEPSTWLLLSIGGLALFYCRHQRK
jgi:hypothetical protein